MLTKVKDSWAIVILLVVSVTICILNYTPGTFLSGWDTLHPEFNFGLNFERTINGVFRVEQGLGAVAAHSHMADLPRITILYLVHFVLPLSFLRYFYIDICIILGTIGMYLFLRKCVLKANSPSFLGGLFYLLNIGTIQTFNVPFEMFTTLFATLPFMFLFATLYLHNKEHRPRNLLLFATVALFNTPSAYAATLWYVFFLCFITYFFIYALVNHRHDHKSFWHFLVLIFVTIAVNLFWLIPNIYFVLLHGKEVAGANINLLFSDQAFLKNKEFGNIRDILLLKSFYFDWKIYTGNNQFADLLSAFINHYKNIYVSLISYILAAGFVTGAIYYIKRLRTYSLPALAVTMICLFFLLNDNFPIAPIYGFFQNHIPFFKEALRFPDDKILNIYIFFVSIFFGYFALLANDKLKKLHHKLHLDKIFVVLVSILIVYYALPSFTGNFINPRMRVSIPKQYFQTFDYLNKQPENLRIANLPIQSPWGWVYYDWTSADSRSASPSYQGAGFLYFGIKQPLLDRDFDRWSPYNESYYREMSYAIYKQDAKLLANVLKKYKIGFILIDKSIVNPQNAASALYFDQSERLINQTRLVSSKQIFGTISLYKLTTNPQVVDSITTNNNVAPKTTTIYSDFAYQQFGDYITYTSSSKLSNIIYPFRDLINNQSAVKENVVSQDDNNIYLTPNTKSASFKAGSPLDSLNTIPIALIANKNNGTLILDFKPSLPTFDNNSLTKPLTQSLKLPSVSQNIYLSINATDLFDLSNLTEGTPTFIANTLLANGTNTIAIFDERSEVPITNTKTIISPFFSSCDDSSQSPTASIKTNSISVQSRGDVCILIPYGFLPKPAGEVLVLTNFQFSFNGDANISSCLFNTQTSTCTLYKNPTASGSVMSLTYPIFVGDASKMALKIFIKPDAATLNTYTLTDISAWYAKPITNLTLSKDMVAQMFTATSKVSVNKIVIPKSNAYSPSVDIAKSQLINGCKAQNAKKEIIEQNVAKIIKYTSVAGSFCDHFSYPNLPHNQSFLVAVDSKNDSGLPLTLCLSDYTSRKCDIYSNLTSEKSVFLLPPMDDNGLGYDLDFENLGITQSPSVNYLSSIEIVPIPYTFLQNISSQSSSTNIFTGKVISFKQYAPWLYFATKSTNPTILSLNQSFEPGFKAYYVSCTSGAFCLLKGLLAPFYAPQIQEHVLVNNWANGWILDQAGNRTIVIIFLPQYFEILGFLVLLVAFILLLYHLKSHKIS